MTNKKGFTLIELLIVIAIIGILASIVLVSLSSARERAKVASFKAQAHSLQAGAVLECDKQAGSLTATVPPNPTANNYLGTRTITTNCTNGDFTISVVSTGLTNACTATMNASGITSITGTDC